jgi:hypothetical protein
VTQGIGDLAALERDLLAVLKHDGARWLKKLLNDTALPGTPEQCLDDEENSGPRSKAVLLTLGWITLRRPYLYSAPARGGPLSFGQRFGISGQLCSGVVKAPLTC